MAPPPPQSIHQSTKHWDIPGFKSVVHFEPDTCLLHTVKPKLDSYFPPTNGSKGHGIPPNNFHCTCPHLQNLRGSLSRLDTLTVLVEDYPLVSDDMRLCVYIRGAQALAMDFAMPKTSDAFSRQAAYAKKEAWFGVRSTKVKLYECDDVRVTLSTPRHNHFFHKFCAVKSPRRLAYTLLLSPMARKWQRNGVQLDIAVDPARRGISLSDIAVVVEVRLVDPDSKRGQKQMNVAQRVCWYGGDGFSKENLAIIALVEKINAQKALGLLQQMSSHKCEFWMWERTSWQEYLFDGGIMGDDAKPTNVKGEFQPPFSRQDFLFFWEDVLRIKRQAAATDGMKEHAGGGSGANGPMGFLPPGNGQHLPAVPGGIVGHMPPPLSNGTQRVKEEKNPSALAPLGGGSAGGVGGGGGAGMRLSNKMEMPQPLGGGAAPGGTSAGDVNVPDGGTRSSDGGNGGNGGGVHGVELGRGGGGVNDGLGSGDFELDFGNGTISYGIGNDNASAVAVPMDTKLSEGELDLESTTTTSSSSNSVDSSHGTRDKMKELIVASDELDFGFSKKVFGFPHHHEASPGTPCASNTGRGKGCIVDMMSDNGSQNFTLQSKNAQRLESNSAQQQPSSSPTHSFLPPDSVQQQQQQRRPQPGAFSPQTSAPPPALPGMVHTPLFDSSSRSNSSTPRHTDTTQQHTPSALPQYRSDSNAQQNFMSDPTVMSSSSSSSSSRPPHFALPWASLPMSAAASSSSIAATSSTSVPGSNVSTPHTTPTARSDGPPPPWGMLIGGLEGLGKGGLVSPAPGNPIAPPRANGEGSFSPSTPTAGGSTRLPSRSPPQLRKASLPSANSSFSSRHGDHRRASNDSFSRNPPISRTDLSLVEKSASPSSSSSSGAHRSQKRRSSAMSSSSPAPIEDDTATVVDAETDDHNPEHLGCHWDVTTSCVPPSGVGRDQCSLGYPNRVKPPSSSDGSSSEDGEPPPPSSSSSGMVYTSSACPTDAGSPRNRAQVRPPDGNEESMSDGSEGDAAGGTRPVKRARVSHSHSVLAPGTWTEAPQCPSASSSSASAGHDHGGHGKVVRNQTTALIDYPHGCSAGSLSNSHEFVAEVKPCGGLDFLCAAALSCDSRSPLSDGAPRHYHHHHLHHHHVLRPPPSSYKKKRRSSSKKQ